MRRWFEPPVSRRRPTALPAILAAALACSLGGAAHAEDVAAAAAAFRQAQGADLKGDRRQAAELYELADSLAPAPQPLRAAIRARRSAGDLAIAATRADALLTRYPDDADSAALARATLADLAPDLVRLTVDCAPDACVVMVDGVVADASAVKAHRLYVTPGSHEVAASFAGRRVKPAKLDVPKGGDHRLAFQNDPPAPRPPAAPTPDGPAEPRPDAPPAPARRGGLSPAWFVAATGATVALGAVTVWSGLDTVSAHREYAKGPTEDGYRDGLGRQRRTNALLASTAVVGVAAGVIGILFTDWSRSPARKRPTQALGVRLEAGPGLGGLAVGGVLP